MAKRRWWHIGSWFVKVDITFDLHEFAIIFTVKMTPDLVEKIKEFLHLANKLSPPDQIGGPK